MSANNFQNSIQPAQNITKPLPAAYYPAMQSAQAVQAPTKGGNVGTVNITINGVNPPGAPPPPVYYPPYMPCYHPNYVPNQQPQQRQQDNPLASQTVKDNKKQEAATPPPAENKPEAPKSEEKMKRQPVEISDDYLKMLEKHLLSKDETTRGKAAAELISRFKEDENRKNDPRLTNLLNLALQDNSKMIVMTALEALDNEYANGNNFTVELLEQIKNQKQEIFEKDEYGENYDFGNPETAEAILIKLNNKKQDNQK